MEMGPQMWAVKVAHKTWIFRQYGGICERNEVTLIFVTFCFLVFLSLQSPNNANALSLSLLFSFNKSLKLIYFKKTHKSIENSIKKQLYIIQREKCDYSHDIQ